MFESLLNYSFSNLIWKFELVNIEMICFFFKFKSSRSNAENDIAVLEVTKFTSISDIKFNFSKILFILEMQLAQFKFDIFSIIEALEIVFSLNLSRQDQMRRMILQY